MSWVRLPHWPIFFLKIYELFCITIGILVAIFTIDIKKIPLILWDFLIRTIDSDTCLFFNPKSQVKLLGFQLKSFCMCAKIPQAVGNWKYKYYFLNWISKTEFYLKFFRSHMHIFFDFRKKYSYRVSGDMVVKIPSQCFFLGFFTAGSREINFKINNIFYNYQGKISI